MAVFKEQSLRGHELLARVNQFDAFHCPRRAHLHPNQRQTNHQQQALDGLLVRLRKSRHMRSESGINLSQKPQLLNGRLTSILSGLLLTMQVRELPSGEKLRNGKNNQRRHIAQGRHEHRDRIKVHRTKLHLLDIMQTKALNKNTMGKDSGPMKTGVLRDRPGQHHRSISKRTCSITSQRLLTMTDYHHQCLCLQPFMKSQSLRRQAMR